MVQPPPEEGCRLCGGRRYWRHRYAGHWVCVRCHPPWSPEVVAEEREAPKPAPKVWVQLPRPMTMAEIMRRAQRSAA